MSISRSQRGGREIHHSGDRMRPGDTYVSEEKPLRGCHEIMMEVPTGGMGWGRLQSGK